MYSSRDNRCSHRLGSPIRTSPDHRLLASPRGFSQLATSFFAFLRQGIHTHALSSLTIKLTLIFRANLRLIPAHNSLFYAQKVILDSRTNGFKPPVRSSSSARPSY